MPKNTLRAPTLEEYKQGLPKTKAEAIKRGLTRFIPTDGQERVIRNYGSEGAPQGGVRKAANRKATRGGGSNGSRSRYERISTPPYADKDAFGDAMARARQQGMQGDHNYDVSRTGAGIEWSEANGRNSREQIIENFRRAGIAIGNQAGNVTPRTEEENNKVKNTETGKLDRGIKNVTGGDEVMGPIRNLSQREQIRITKPPTTPKTNQPQTSGGYQVRNKGESRTPPISSNRNVLLDVLSQAAPAPLVQAITAAGGVAALAPTFMKSLFMSNPGGL